IIAGDESLSSRPMKRIADPLSDMGAEVITTDGHLPLTIHGRKLLPYEYRLPVASAQVKSSLLLAGVAAGCSVIVREDVVTRDHTELMLRELGCAIESRTVKPERISDPRDPRKTKLVMPEKFKKEISLPTKAIVGGGTLDIPGDFSTAAFFFALAALSKKSITVENVGINHTRAAFLDHLKYIGCEVDIADRIVVSGEPRASVTVTGGALKGRKVSGGTTTAMIDEIPLVAVLAAVSGGTTVIRDADELRVKESDRLAAVAHNLTQMGISCGLLDDGLAIEGKKELNGGDFSVFGDHRIAMAFSVAALVAVGPSTIDDDSVVDVSCPGFYELLQHVCQ
ncbi:MAG: 3-phosphoshikimate 1-carboxyvinyltransferase, partial [candidate division Zixibacteria bacterium]|nr:3-phosphoshikimate 1-carboxyvinyltransferase [candidate division Zixibacteria bacterium]